MERQQMSRLLFAVCMLMIACRLAFAEDQHVALRVAKKELGPVLPAAAPDQVCPRPDAPYAPTPVGLVTSSNTSKMAVLRQKRADIAQLQHEVDQLRGEAGAKQQITVRVEVMEVSLTKMEKTGVDATNVSSGYANMTAADAKQLLRTLSESNLGKMVSEPTVVTLDGNPASLHVGGEVPHPARNGAKGEVELRPIGTQLDVLPQTLGENRVRLDFRLRMSNIDSGQMVDINGSHVPVLNVEEVDTKIETAIGDSVVLSGMEETRVESQKRSTGKTEEVRNRIGTIFVVTPEVSDRVGRVGALPVQPRPYTPK
jgi:Flp pilus assembly secretin CpaC